MSGPNCARTLTVLLAVAASAAFASDRADAADRPSARQRAAVLQAILDCRARQDEAERLACYDAASAQLDQAEASGQVVVIDKDQARQVRRETFGLQFPSLGIFGGGKEGGEEEIERVTETVKAASMNAQGRWVVELESGAVWRQIDSEDLEDAPKSGSKAEIRKASLGSFFMKVDGQRAMRVRRER